jgi:hypothetical protein
MARHNRPFAWWGETLVLALHSYGVIDERA